MKKQNLEKKNNIEEIFKNDRKNILDPKLNIKYNINSSIGVINKDLEINNRFNSRITV